MVGAQEAATGLQYHRAVLYALEHMRAAGDAHLPAAILAVALLAEMWSAFTGDHEFLSCAILTIASSKTMVKSTSSAIK